MSRAGKCKNLNHTTNIQIIRMKKNTQVQRKTLVNEIYVVFCIIIWLSNI